MESNWLDSFYEALEFFYWEPQHIFPKRESTAELEALAKVVKKASRAEDVKKHLRKMEVTLNHNIRQFFLLAPDALRREFFEEIFGEDFRGDFWMHGREVDTEFKLAGAMQPDFLFVSEAKVVSIEMKVKAKCSVDQVLKYALLCLAVEIKQGQQQEHYLILLGSNPFAGMFRPRFEDMAKLKEAIAKENLTSFLLNKPAYFRREQHQQRFNKIVEKMRVEFLSYGGFARFLGEAKPPQTDQSPGAEVYRKLISGLTAEFERRKLA